MCPSIQSGIGSHLVYHYYFILTSSQDVIFEKVYANFDMVLALIFKVDRLLDPLGAY